MIQVIFKNNNYIVCIKPIGVSSQKSEGQNMIDILSDITESDIYPVHRLDTAVSGVMVYAKNSKTASYLSKLIQNGDFNKEYLAVIHGVPEKSSDLLVDLLFKDSKKNKSFVVKRERKGVKKASLEYTVLSTVEINGKTCSLVHIKLHTGRSHQIRVQFSSRKMPLYGDGKYGGKDNDNIALYSYRVGFDDNFYEASKPETYPWCEFDF